jgi:phosphatidylglycerophosphatase A
MRIKLRHILLATGLGMGFSPIAPGTIGAVEGCITALFIKQYAAYPDLLLAFFSVLFFLLGVHCSNKLETDWGKDPSIIIIDEVVGMWIAMLMLPKGWIYIAAAFLLFRLFDIYKPLYIRKMEKLKGGWGIMMDDVLAGIYANGAIQLFYIIYSIM